MTDSISQFGTRLGPDVVGAVRALYEPEQAPIAASLPLVALDCAYGPDARNRLDLYRSGAAEDLRPVALFVHGGGFLVGDKGGESGWANAHVGRWAAANGMVGAVMNYRLAPQHMWPSGAEDVGLAVDWLRAHVAGHGGDPDRIFLLGTSAGAVHVSAFFKAREDHADLVRGAALLSGLYGVTPLDERDMLYYGPQDCYGLRMPLSAVMETRLPLLLACAEFDPPRFQAEWASLLQARLGRHGHLPRAHYASGHNHYSMAMHLGTSDHRLSDELLSFFADHS
ncbi:acetyl esterase/lipase [Novosphingobium sp. PhB165]|uniref:alpha/beta hydrolase n=1 Tax=Novosphingobium sp. PhB165 TaxID=2485105 RepID=UPI001053E620|nr:alpha/beta hydrolase [Novosphingobium sp. PhB165]TCM19731.1 acetyl esterase/lipase [Novosphingobium sp. PhB165]